MFGSTAISFPVEAEDAVGDVDLGEPIHDQGEVGMSGVVAGTAVSGLQNPLKRSGWFQEDHDIGCILQFDGFQERAHGSPRTRPGSFHGQARAV